MVSQIKLLFILLDLFETHDILLGFFENWVETELDQWAKLLGAIRSIPYTVLSSEFGDGCRLVSLSSVHLQVLLSLQSDSFLNLRVVVYIVSGRLHGICQRQPRGIWVQCWHGHLGLRGNDPHGGWNKSRLR